MSKKKAGRALEEAEFEEDVIEDDFDEPTVVGSRFDPSLSGSTSQQAALTPAERKARKFENNHAELARALSVSAFALRSDTPRAAPLHALLSEAPLADLPRAIEMLALWHSKAVPLPNAPHLTEALVTLCAKLATPSTAVAVLADRKTYGLDLASTPPPKIALLFASLRINGAKLPIEQIARDAAMALALVELAKPTDGPSIRIAQMSTLAILVDAAAKVGEQSQVDFAKKAQELLASVRKAGVRTLIEDGTAMASRPRGRLANTLEYLVAAFQTQGLADDAKLFQDVLASVRY